MRRKWKCAGIVVANLATCAVGFWCLVLLYLHAHPTTRELAVVSGLATTLLATFTWLQTRYIDVTLYLPPWWLYPAGVWLGFLLPPQHGGYFLAIYSTLGLIASSALLWHLAWPPPDTPDLRQVQAQLRTLENQIQPHFFHNTLNTIAALIPTDPAKAEQTVRNLSDLYRLVMQTNAPQVPLTQELDFARRYLAIEAARFGDRLAYHLPTPEQAHNLQVPPLALQPVIENAIKHGIAKRIAGGRVEVALAKEPTAYTIRVTSPSEEDAPPVKDFFPKGHALAITRERLSLLYGKKAQMEARQHNGFTEVSLTLPA